MSMPALYGLYPLHSGDLAVVDVICFKEFGPLGLTVRIKSDWDEVGYDVIVAWLVVPFEVEFKKKELDVGIGA